MWFENVYVENKTKTKRRQGFCDKTKHFYQKKSKWYIIYVKNTKFCKCTSVQAAWSRRHVYVETKKRRQGFYDKPNHLRQNYPMKRMYDRNDFPIFCTNS